MVRNYLMMHDRTIAEDIRAGTSTGGRIIIGPHGVLPFADPIAVKPLTAEQEKDAAKYQAQLGRDLKALARFPTRNPEKGRYTPGDLRALQAQNGWSMGRLARELAIPRKTLLRKMKGTSHTRDFDVIKGRTLSGT